MSVPRRAYNILRGYVGREWERIKGVEASDALRELEQPLVQRNRDSVKERIEQAEKVPPEMLEKYARQLLGVDSDADFEEIRRSYDRLHRRSAPENFPVGSPEREKAAELRSRVEWAFEKLTERLDSTEKRFKTLEIE